jgi:hypothetical protein
MPIEGLPRWNAPDAYYSQANNVVESILGKMQAKAKLISCGPTAAVMLLDAIGANISTMTPGGWKPQPEDMLAAYMNDPRNYPEMLKYRSDVSPEKYLGNTIPQWYEASVPAVFGVKARFYWGVSFEKLMQAIIGNTRGVMLCLENPGHFIAGVAIDADKREVIYHDPWPDNFWPARLKGTPGRARRVSWQELGANLQPYMVEIGA